MKLLEAIRIALRARAANKLRSALTMLGIVIGVGAVITLLSVGEGVERFVTQSIQSTGSNLLFVVPGALGEGGNNVGSTLTVGDAEATAASVFRASPPNLVQCATSTSPWGGSSTKPT